MSTAANSNAQEKEETWKWIEARVWQNTQSGVYYERPTVNGRPLSVCRKGKCFENGVNNPVHTIRNGSISVSIWLQDTEKGPMFNVTFQRSYKEGEEWKNSTSFSRTACCC